MTGPDHYEVELREIVYEDDGTGGLQVTGVDVETGPGVPQG